MVNGVLRIYSTIDDEKLKEAADKVEKEFNAFDREVF